MCDIKKSKAITLTTEMIFTLKYTGTLTKKQAITPQPKCNCGSEDYIYDCIAEQVYCAACGCPIYNEGKEFHGKYSVGDILYVREEWARTKNGFEYKTDFPECYCEKKEWNSPTTMPKEAIRAFLRVTDVHINRLQDIMSDLTLCPREIKQTGLYNTCCYCYHPNGECSDFIKNGTCKLFNEYVKSWNRKLRDKNGWNSNPYVFSYDFEKAFFDTTKK